MSQMSTDLPSLPDLLADRARRRPDAPAYTFVDHQINPDGRAETLTWSQVHGRAQAIAVELQAEASAGDRVALLAPPGIDYITGFFGALQAGMVAVPLPAPVFGAHDERAAAALKDCTPTAVLTTSTLAGHVVPILRDLPTALPVVIEADALDPHPTIRPAVTAPSKTAFLQYTSGSTRSPAGVAVSHRNAIANMRQMLADTFADHGGTAPPDTTAVSWLPLYHDLGLMCSIVFPVVTGVHAVVMSPAAFLQKPARWMQLVARHNHAYTGGPNFAYELAVRRTTDEDMAGLDLGHVHTLAFGAERVQPATLRRVAQRFARFNLPTTALRPGYGLAEATVYVTSCPPGRAPRITRFDPAKLSAGFAQPSKAPDGVELAGCGVPRACTLRIVDPDTQTENPAGAVGEIWVHGENVASGYWGNPQASRDTFAATLASPLPNTPPGPWLRTGDLGAICDDELYVVGRIKDVLIVDGRNHYPDDIEATVQEITRGRAAAISAEAAGSERLVVIVEIKDYRPENLGSIKRQLASAVSRSHGLKAADVVLVSPGSIPITTSGKVRRSACVEDYHSDRFRRLDSGRP